MADAPDLVLVTYIRTTPQALWTALTTGQITAQYFHRTAITADLRVGGRLSYRDAAGTVHLEGEILEIEPERLLVTTFEHKWTDQGEPTRVRYEIAQLGDVCKFTLTHYDYAKSRAGVESGWPVILAGLKTLLETGAPLNIPVM
jgi:uncharacterized protein YndB with AHSA1/START domain